MLEPPSQVERLLGDGVRSACDARYGWDCLAVRRGLRLSSFATRPVLPECADDGFTSSVGVVRLRGWPVTVAVAHPDSTVVPCRAAQLRDLFGALPAAGPVLVLGDLNVDFHREDDESAAAVKASGLDVLSSDELTSFPGAPSQLDPTGSALDGDVALPAGPLGPRTLDHVLTRGLSGTCDVLRVDGGGGMDHRAQVCSVTVPASVTPALRLRRRGCRVRVSFPGRDDVAGARLRLGLRSRVDREAPFTIRGRARGLRVRALTLAGAGPQISRRLRPC